MPMDLASFSLEILVKMKITMMLSVILLLCSVEASLFSASAHRELEQMKIRVDMVHDRLISEDCPEPDVQKTQRRHVHSTAAVDFEIETQLYRYLTHLLIQCRNNKVDFSTTPVISTTEPTPTSTTGSPLPTECLTAINLTESWRLDHSGSYIRPINGNYNTDPRDMVTAGRPWFRFIGNAGNKLADFCVPVYSCGTGATLWSNSTMPSSVGVVSQITIYAHTRPNVCDAYSFRGSVMRCSNVANDFIYRYDDEYSEGGVYGFCGMNA